MGCGPSKFKGEGQRLGSAASSPTTVTRPPTNRAPMAVAAPAVPAPARTRPAQATLGSGSPPTGDAAKRAAAAAAAERRLQGEAARGTSTTNANQGRLASQLEKQKRGQVTADPVLPERVVWD